MELSTSSHSILEFYVIHLAADTRYKWVQYDGKVKVVRNILDINALALVLVLVVVASSW